MPIVRRPGTVPEGPSTLRVEMPLPETLDDQIALVTKLIRTKNITHLSINPDTVNYDFIKSDVDDDIVQWYLNQRSD